MNVLQDVGQYVFPAPLSVQAKLCGSGAGSVAPGAVSLHPMQDDGNQGLADPAGAGHPDVR